MPKLTEKTMKEGQKCVLTVKTPLFHDYKYIRKNDTDKLTELLALPNIAYRTYEDKYVNLPGEKISHFLDPNGLDPKRIIQPYSKHNYGHSKKYYTDEICGVMISVEIKSTDGDVVYSHISPTKLKKMTEQAKISNYISGIGEMKPIINLDKDTEIEIYKMSHWSQDAFKNSMHYENVDWDSQVALKVISGPYTGTIFTSGIKAIKSRLDTAHFEDLAAAQNAKPKYKIYYKGEPYRIDTQDWQTGKPKKGASKIFTDLGKVKASLMGRFGYHEKIYQLNQHYKDLSPEVGCDTPEWIGGYGSTAAPEFSRKDCKDIQVFEWVNSKKGKEADFNALEYYDSLMDFVKVTAQYGSAVREQYKTYKGTGEFSTIVCFMHEDYRLPEFDSNGHYNSVYYEELKESETIKNAMKLSKVKGTKKCTKNGKTAICFKNESDAMRLLRHLDKGSYFVLDMNGNELVEQSEQFVRNVARMKKLERILIEEFENDFVFDTQE